MSRKVVAAVTDLDGVEALRRLHKDPETAVIPTLAFYAYVEVDRAAQARDAGCERVIPRSHFSRNLVELLRVG